MRAQRGLRPYGRYLADEGLSDHEPKWKLNRMADAKREELPIFIAGDRRKGPLTCLVTRLIIVAVITMSISVVTVILLIQKLGATWDVASVMVSVTIVPATIAVVVNYLYWRPGYKVARALSRSLNE